MTDVLCDFCHRAWTADMPIVEGHRGAMICGTCLSIAYRQIVCDAEAGAGREFYCRMCREEQRDREALNRGGEHGWASPVDPEAVICRRCIKLGAGVLHKDPDYDWRKPESA
jgi:hypothetical protein